MGIFNIYKPAGLTPLEVLEKLRGKKPELVGQKLTYAGRLDPLAEGVMLVLSGEDIKNKDQFLRLSKTYEIEVLFGVSTDTGDVLGLVQEFGNKKVVTRDEVEKVVRGFLGPRRQTAPPFSSPGLDGKIFEKEVEIYTVSVGEEVSLSTDFLLSDIIKRVGVVTGDFRQREIIKHWSEVLVDKSKVFSICKLVISASSGTYMRLLAEEVGQELNLPYLAYHIKRVKVGNYEVGDALTL
jgi:tRNA pseudouridine55 synthase